MAVKIRLARFGRKKIPFYRIIAADGEMPRDGRFLEHIGSLNRLSNPPIVALDEERFKHWITNGAKPSKAVASLVEERIPGYLSGIVNNRRDKIRATRTARKARAKARA